MKQALQAIDAAQRAQVVEQFAVAALNIDWHDQGQHALSQKESAHVG